MQEGKGGTRDEKKRGGRGRRARTKGGEEAVSQDAAVDPVLRQPVHHRLPLERRQELVIASGDDDHGAASTRRLLRKVGRLEQARRARAVEERVLRQRRDPRPLRALLAHHPPALAAGHDRLARGGRDSTPSHLAVLEAAPVLLVAE